MFCAPLPGRANNYIQTIEMITPERNYRDILRDELNRRTGNNPRYSLRSFARDLKLAPSRLSEIFNGKQGLSKVSAQKIANTLGYSTQERTIFCDLVESMHARSKITKQAAQLRLQKHMTTQTYKTIELDAFTAVSDWYHFAIVFLMKLDGFQSDPDWIAKKLEISRSEVTSALERLERLKLIEKKGTQYRALQDYISTTDGIPSDAIKKFHSQILEKAAAALYTQSVDERDFSTILMAIDSRNVGDIKKRIKKFRRSLNRSATATGIKDQLYSLSIQFFRVSRKEHFNAN